MCNYYAYFKLVATKKRLSVIKMQEIYFAKILKNKGYQYGHSERSFICGTF